LGGYNISMKFKLTLLIPLLVYTNVFSNRLTAKTTQDTTKIDTIAADFPGGLGLFYDYLRTHVKYPIASRLKGVQGKVHLKFVIDTNGDATKVKVTKGLDKLTNLEAQRVIRNSPKWIPGTINGKKTPFDFNIPLSFTDTSSYEGADVMVNGKLFKRNDMAFKLPLDSMHYYIIPENLTKAVLGSEFNKKLLVFNGKNPNLKGYNQAHFKYSFEMLKNVDTSKVQLNVFKQELRLEEWQKYLNKDSIITISIFPAASSKTYDSKKIGTIVLMNKAGFENQNRMKRDLIEDIVAYRAGQGKLPKGNLLIDNYNFLPLLVFNAIDTAVIKGVNVLDSSETTRMYGDAYKNGVIYIYTKNYNEFKPTIDKNKVFSLINEYKLTLKAPVDDHIYVNNIPVDFKKLVAIPPSAVQYVKIVTKEEMKSFLGVDDTRNSIFIHTTSEFQDKERIEVKVLPPPDVIK
jgi:TonB family protein